MPKIKFSKANREAIEVPSGSNLMEVLLENNIPVASSCGGELVCAKCYVEVHDGSYNLNLCSQDERDFMEIKDIPKNCRMACKTIVEGDITIDTPYW